MFKSQIFNVPTMSFNAIRENKLLAKISEFSYSVFVFFNKVELKPACSATKSIKKIEVLRVSSLDMILSNK